MKHALLTLACAAILACGTNVDLGGSAIRMDGATMPDDGKAPLCPGYASPDTSAKCVACKPSSHDCQPNGCYNGYYCELSRLDCTKRSEACDGGAKGSSASD
jgi:hypothetical protein